MARKSRLSAPSHPLWLIAVLLGALALLVHFRILPALSPLHPYEFWLMTAGWAALVLGTALRGV